MPSDLHPNVEERVLHHLLRYRMTTALALERLLPTLSSHDVKTTLDVMLECGILEALPIPASAEGLSDPNINDLKSAPQALAPVYAMTEKGFRFAGEMLGLPLMDPSAPASDIPSPNYQPLSDIHRLRAYGMLAFCFLDDTPREILTATQVLERYPSLAHMARKAVHFYREDTERGERLGVCYVDPGRSPQRLAQEMRKLSYTLESCQDAKTSRQERRLALGLVVADDAQTRCPLLKLLRQGRPLLTPLTMVVAPQLAQFQRPQHGNFISR